MVNIVTSNGSINVSINSNDASVGLSIESEKTYSPQVYRMLANYAEFGTALEGNEKLLMINYVNSSVASGNYAKKDFEVVFSLSGNNSLVDYIGGKVISPVDSPAFTTEGVDLNGTSQYIDTNYNASDSSKYSLDSNHISVFVNKYDPLVIQNKALWGSGSRSYLYKFTSANLENRNNGGSKTISDNFYSGNLYTSERVSAGSFQLYESGIKIIDEADNSIGIDNADIFIGSLLGSGFYDGSLCIASFGEGGLNHSSDYSEKLTLLQGLGATIPTVELVTAFDGNSLTEGSNNAGIDQYYTKEIQKDLYLTTKSHSFNSFGVSGRTIQECITNALINSDPVVEAGKTNISILWEDANGIAEGNTGLENYNYAVTFFENRKAAGFDYGVLVLGYYFRTPYGGGWSEAKEAEQEDYFNRVLATVGAPWDKVVDLRDAENIGGAKGQAIDGVYFNDWVHLNAIGYDIVAEKVKEAINELI